MKIINTSRKPKQTVVRAVNFGVDFVGARGVVETVVLCDLEASYGWCHKLGEKSLIMIQLSPEASYPIHHKDPRVKTAPKYTMHNYVEHLVSTACHEAQHAMDYAAGRRMSELRAERAAVAALNAWRSRAKT